MAKGKLIWVPYPYKAGFCITDDTDAADYESVKIVYDFLQSIRLLTTKTVWVFDPEEPSGIPHTPPSTLRGVTLQDTRYFNYCKQLSSAGYEICLHGASAGNNKRKKTQTAIEYIRSHFGNSDTYINHSKNAENIYWEESIVSNKILKQFLTYYTSHKHYGEIEGNEYFWGDICRKYIKYIRLYRTRRTNTLAVNPSMPYFDPRKPFVKSWFTATKRSFRDCTTPTALLKLKRSSGLTVLYQYLHRYADKSKSEVTEHFKQGAKRLMEDGEILVKPTNYFMNRLRLIQGIYILFRKNRFWIYNTNNEDIENLQILSPGINRFYTAETGNLHSTDDRLHIPCIKMNSFIMIKTSKRISFSGKRTIKLPKSLTAEINFGFGTIYFNLSKTIWNPNGIDEIPSNGYRIVYDDKLKLLEPVSTTTIFEQIRLFSGQIMIIIRELLLKNRSLNVDKYLSSDKILMENHENW